MVDKGLFGFHLETNPIFKQTYQLWMARRIREFASSAKELLIDSTFPEVNKLLARFMTKQKSGISTSGKFEDQEGNTEIQENRNAVKCSFHCV